MLENFKKGVKKIFMAQSQCDKTSVPKEQAIKITLNKRPDLIKKYNFSEEEKKILEKIENEVPNM